MDSDFHSDITSQTALELSHQISYIMRMRDYDRFIN